MSSPTTVQCMKERYGERYRWLLLMAVMVGTMASVMSSTVVNVAIPDLSHHFALGQQQAQWVSSSFMVAMTASMLLTPWLLDRYGYRLTYVSCMVLLLLGGIVGGVAQDYALVLGARVAEGLAAGIVQPIPAIIIMHAFLPQEQGRASGLFTLGVVLAPALGPSVGGLLVDWFGWRSIFFMVIPLCLLSIWLAYRFVPSGAPGGKEAHSNDHDLDVLGLVLSTAGTVCLLVGLTYADQVNWQAALYLGAAVVLGLCFVAWERHMSRQGRQPLLELELFRTRQFAMGCVVAFIYGTALFGSTYLLPVFMQLGLQLAPSYVGTILLPAGIVLAITIAGVGRLADRQPTHWLVGIGLGLLALSFALTFWIHTTTPLWVLVVLTAVGRIGLGFILPSLNLGAMRPLSKAMIAQGSSAIGFVRMLGGSAGVSLCAVFLEWRVAAHGANLTEAATSPERIAAFGDSFVMLAALCLLALLASWHLRPTATETAASPRARR